MNATEKENSDLFWGLKVRYRYFVMISDAWAHPRHRAGRLQQLRHCDDAVPPDSSSNRRLGMCYAAQDEQAGLLCAHQGGTIVTTGIDDDVVAATQTFYNTVTDPQAAILTTFNYDASLGMVRSFTIIWVATIYVEETFLCPEHH